jgi:hypothetical protein
MKCIKKYVKVMGLMHKDLGMITEEAAVLRMLSEGDSSVEIASWPGGIPILYFDRSSGDIVYANDMVYKYVVSGNLSTPKELIDMARIHGYRGNKTSEAASILRSAGHIVSINPEPTNKYVI